VLSHFRQQRAEKLSHRFTTNQKMASGRCGRVFTV
jgi:hypothetical protein